MLIEKIRELRHKRERDGYISRNHAKIIRKAIESTEDTK